MERPCAFPLLHLYFLLGFTPTQLPGTDCRKKKIVPGERMRRICWYLSQSLSATPAPPPLPPLYPLSACPKSRAEDVRLLFPGEPLEGMLLVPTCQKSGVDLAQASGLFSFC